MSEPRIVPEETALTEPYWAAAREGKIALQRCAKCGAVWHPPQPACPRCYAHDVSWFHASGVAKLDSFTVVHHAAHKAVEGKTPYTVALVELEEGQKVICNLVKVNREDIKVGMKLRIVPEMSVGGTILPQAVAA